ncbi:DEAD/DEAH box helicase [Kitasatospora sp. NBC_01302]|uniref:DEAD/DEAH box helicase n=1 Tax=Kitasatospora sp. NBC_01302 TaxID=2903575 RepID=UPI002E10DA58|nr:DEAD/DEAH box helicase [Kitasatospora sp. NBC_01302]
MTLPVALTGHDVIGQAKTGTGKTLGFGLPLIERAIVRADVDAGRATEAQLSDSPQALIVVPTRELCTQVTNDLQTAGKVRNVRVLAIYGGRAYEPQVEALNKGVDIVVGTPGRLLDLAGQKKLDLSKVRALVLDEADEMLDLGFLPDVEKIITMLPAKRQTLLFSATMPGQVISLARRYMSQPTHIRAAAPDDSGHTVANTTQHIFRAHSLDKVELVSRILQADGRGLAMIFCRTKRTAADVSDQLTQRGFAAGAVHGDLGQGAREQALRAFRSGKVDVLVCTDVAARGIDVEGVTHVINYQCPEDEKTYLHRIGRTGRAGASGTAVTLVDWDDIPRWQLINKALELGFSEPEETYSTSPHLYELLNIAPGTKGVLPRSERTRAGLAAEEVEDLGETGGRGARSGRGDRGGDRDRGRGRGGADSSGPRRGPAVEQPAAEERPARAPRNRRRTRGGASVAGEQAQAQQQVTAGGQSTAAPAGGPVSVDGESTAPRRRRRRSRGGASGEAQVAAAVAAPQSAQGEVTVAEPAAAPAPAVETLVVEAPAAATVVPSQAEAPAEESATPAVKKTTRTRKSAAKQAAAVEAPAAEAPAVVETIEAEAAPAPAKKTTRTRKTAAKKTTAPEATVTEAPATEVTTEPEAAPAKARKTAAKRTTKKATAAEAPAIEAPAVVETIEAEATPAPAKKTTRTRKTAAKKTTAPEATVTEAPATEVTTEPEAAPAKARKTAAKRTTKKATAAEAPAIEAPAVVETIEAEATPAPAKKTTRTRKATAKKTTAPEATVTEAPATEAVPAPRRRTRKAVAEAPVAD